MLDCFSNFFLYVWLTETVLCIELSRNTSLAFLALYNVQVALDEEMKTSKECNSLSFIIASTFNTSFFCFHIVPSSVVFSAFGLFAKFILIKKLFIVTLYPFLKNSHINHKQISAGRLLL